MEFEVKQKNLKTKKNSHTALSLYIKLYCKRKGSSKTKYLSNLVEATKSWLSLSESEKQQFKIKHKECEQKFYLHQFNQLKDAEPYMKIKDERFDNISLNTGNEIHQEFDAYTKEVSPHNERELSESEEINLGSEDVPNNIEFQRHQDEGNEIVIESINAHEQNIRTLLVEPLPPTLKTGRDLFHIINSMDEANNLSWTSLPRLEKNQYNRAVLLLKKDYMTKYKAYLENLTAEELFNYYNKTFL